MAHAAYRSGRRRSPPAPPPDTQDPTAPVLTPTPGVQQVKLDWTASTDNVGLDRYEIWMDDAWVDGVAPGVLTYTVTGLVGGASHTFKVVAYDTSERFANSNIVTSGALVVGNDPLFNSVYSANGRLWNTADDTQYHGRWLNAHSGGFSFSQATFTKWAGEGFNGVRLCFDWKRIEPTQGNFDTTQIGYVKTSAARAKAAGLKVMLCPLINTPTWADAVNRIPEWAKGTNGPAFPVGEWNTASQFDCLCSSGEAYLRRIMQEFRTDDNVIGMEFCNEPDRSSAGPIQRGTNRMLAWVRAEDNGAGKLWFVATNMYSSQSASASFNDWNAITDYTNVVAQMHTYFAPQSATNDGWNTSNGLRRASEGMFWNGDPEATSYSTANKAAFALHFATWKAFAESKGIPWIVGEAGVRYAQPGTTEAMRVAWCTDVTDAAETAGASAIAGWIASDTFAQDVWGSHNGGAVRAEYDQFSTFTSTPPSGGSPPPQTISVLGGAVQAQSTATTTHAMWAPQPIAARTGKVAYVGLATDGGVLSGTGIPTGWTRLIAQTTLTNPRLYIYRRVLDGSGNDDFSVTSTTAIQSSITFVILNNANTTTPEDATPTTNASSTSSTTATAPGLTVTTAGTALLLWYAANAYTATFTITGGASLAELYDAGNGKAQMLAQELNVAAAATGNRSATISQSLPWAAAMVPVRPAPG